LERLHGVVPEWRVGQGGGDGARQHCGRSSPWLSPGAHLYP
jgi:hypothetical protein